MSKLLHAAIATAASFLVHPLALADTQYVLMLQSNGTGFGTIHTAPNDLDCAANAGYGCGTGFPANSDVDVSVAPDAGSVFAGWSGACTGTGSCRVHMDGFKTVTATVNAAPGTNYLTVTTWSDDAIGRGSVVSSPPAIDCPATKCRANLPSDSVVTLMAVPAAGSKLDEWSGACTGTGTCQVSMNAQRRVTANFAVESPESVNFTSLWWVPTESGWGLNLNHQGDILFATLFTYDRAGAPLWLVMSAGRKGPLGFFYQGDLHRTTGSAFNAVPFLPPSLTKVGTMELQFYGFDRAELQYTFDGARVTKVISRQVFGSRAANCASTNASRASSTNYQDLWWNPDESGWGINVTHQDDILFATLFTYDATGRDLWLVMSAGRKQADGSFFGDLFRTKGPAFNANPFTPITPGDLASVGTMRLSFSDGNHGTLGYTYNGTLVTKPITRQLFAATAPMCN